MYCPYSCQKGFTSLEGLVGVFLIVLSVALVLFFARPDYFVSKVEDLLLALHLRRISNEIKNFGLNSEPPTCKALVGSGRSCSNIVFDDITSCECPYFTAQNMVTGLDPYPGIKYIVKGKAFCLSAVANNSDKGKFLKIESPTRDSVHRSEESCK